MAALEGFFALAAKLDWLYPPDFSDRDQIALRTTGNRLFAQVFTDRPTVLRLVLHVPARREFVVRSAKDLEDGELARGLAEAISAIGAGGG